VLVAKFLVVVLHEVEGKLRTVSLNFSLDSCGFVILQCPLWREDVSVISCCCWSSPAKTRSGLSHTGLKTIFYCLNLETAPTWWARSPYLYPSGTGRPRYAPDTGFLFRLLLWLAVLRWKYSIPPPRWSFYKNRKEFHFVLYNFIIFLHHYLRIMGFLLGIYKEMTETIWNWPQRTTSGGIGVSCVTVNKSYITESLVASVVFEKWRLE
jgi:hypothetical protein